MLTQLALPTQELQEVLQPTCFCIKLLNTVPFNVKWILTELPHCVRRFDDLMSKSLENCSASLSWTGTLLRMRLIPVISPSSWFTVAVALFFLLGVLSRLANNILVHYRHQLVWSVAHESNLCLLILIMKVK